MGALNKVMLIGNLGRDAEMRYTPGGTAVSTLNLATTEVFKDREGQKKEDTQWHRVILWGKTAESLNEYLKKGKQVYVEGKLQTRKWKDKDGNDKYTTEIRGERVQLLGGTGGGKNRAPHPADDADADGGAQQPPRHDEAGSQAAGDGALTDDDIPF